MKLRITVHKLSEVINSHPTLSEIVLEAIENVNDMTIHKTRRRR